MEEEMGGKKDNNKKQITKKVIIIGIFACAILLLLHVVLPYIGEYRTKKERESHQMDQSWQDMYNSNISAYINEGVKGSEVKSMIDAIISQNNENIGDEAKFIGLMIAEGDSISSYNTKEQEELKKACEKASVFSSKDGTTIVDGENNEKNVKNAATQMEKLKRKIGSQKHYNTSVLTSQGYYTWVIISEVK